MTSPSHCPRVNRTHILGSKERSAPVAGRAHPSPSVSTAHHCACVPSAPDGLVPDQVAQKSTQPGRFRWIVFQARKSGPFRLTQNLWADHRSQATTLADALYEGCVGTLTVMSVAEYEAAQDDVAAIRRTRLAPKGEGEKRPYCRRGTSYGACNYCGTITTANGGRAPDYCADHNSRPMQEAYRRAQRQLAQGVAS